MPKASDIAAALRAPLVGRDIEVKEPRSLSGARPGALVFLNKIHVDAIERLNATSEVVCIATPEVANHLTCPVITVVDPRLGFCLAMNRFFSAARPTGVSGDATVDPGARLGSDVRVEAGARIATGAIIGDRTVIGENCVISNAVRIGHDCLIKPNTTIGARGFGFADGEDGIPVPFPHIGGVVIGNHVEIGANCTVVRAALDDTVVGDFVKTDDHVHIAHNCIIGARTKIAAGAVLSGSVTVGEDVWISPNSTIIDYGSIGDGAFVGIGSVVTKSVRPGIRVFGVPAAVLAKKNR